MHLADAFIQSDLQLHSGYTFFCQTPATALVKTNQFIIYYLFIREYLNRKRSLWHIGKSKTNKNKYRYIKKNTGSNHPPGHRETSSASNGQGHGLGVNDQWVTIQVCVCVCTWMGKCRAQILSMGHHTTWPHVTSLHVTSVIL